MTIPRNTLFIRCTTNADTPGGIGAGHRIIFKNRARDWTMTDITAFKDYYAPMATMRVIIEHSDNVEIVTAVKVDLLKPLYGDNIAEDLYTWYRRAYPWDTIAEDINAKVTFCDIWDALNDGKGRDIYDYIGADDSIVRERVFTRLSELLNKSYDDIYDLWLNAA